MLNKQIDEWLDEGENGKSWCHFLLYFGAKIWYNKDTR